MAHYYRSPLRAMESENLATWLKLRRELEERITDEETLELFHQFAQADIALCEEEADVCFWNGVSTGVSVMKELEAREKKEFEKLYRQIKRNASKGDAQQKGNKPPKSTDK